tara:strand:- start:102 stop:695 length:594 start_codon:yes stop_codon:yes gene_type:complete
MISLQFPDEGGRGEGGSDDGTGDGGDGGGGERDRTPAQEAEKRGQEMAEKVLSKAAYKLRAAHDVRDRYPAHAYRLAVAARHEARQLEANPVVSDAGTRHRARAFTRGATVLIDRLGARLFNTCLDQCLPRVVDMERGYPGHAEWVGAIYEGMPREMAGGARKRRRVTKRLGAGKSRRRPRVQRTTRRRAPRRRRRS